MRECKPNSQKFFQKTKRNTFNYVKNLHHSKLIQQYKALLFDYVLF